MDRPSRITPRSAALGLLAGAAVAACLVDPGSSTSRTAPAPRAPTATTLPNEPEPSDAGGDARIDLSAEVRASIVRGDERRVLVVVDPPASPCAAAALAPSDGLRVLRTYAHVPVAVVAVRGAAALRALASRPSTRRVVDDVAFRPSLAHSLPLVAQPAALAAGYDGTGTTVAVLDTGCDYTREAFGACPEAGASGCPVVVAKDIAPDDGQRDAPGHGTNVAGIVLGMAPGTKIAALDVFDGPSAYSSDILTAIEWVIDQRATYGIVALNLSLGGGAFDDACDAYPVSLALAAARSAGVLASVAAGNDGHADAIAYPACASAALAVGAVYSRELGLVDYGTCSDAETALDQITCFSNASSRLALLAPGAPITAAGVTMFGTSQAAPHVAGAIALLRSALPSEPIETLATRLVRSGKPITDARSGLVFPRLDVASALAWMPPTDPPDASARRDASASTTSPCP